MGNSCFCEGYKHFNETKEVNVGVDYEKNKNRFNEIQKSIDIYFKDIEEKNKLIQKFLTFLDKLNIDLNKIFDNMNISIFDNYKKELNFNDTNEMLKFYSNKLKDISDKINNFKNIIENIKNNTFTKVENLYELIQNSLNNYNFNDIIDNKFKELEELNKYLKEKKDLHDIKKEEIEKDIEEIQTIVKKFAKNSEFIYSSLLESLKLNSDEIKISTKFLKNSMLLDLKEYLNSDIFKSTKLFNEDDNNENQENQNLLEKNWNEKCYIYDEYDLYDVNYELKAVGLPPNVYFSSSSFPFYVGSFVEINEFEIDGKKTEYKYENYSLKYEINLKNMESNKIHINYKEIHSKENEGESTEKKIYRNNYYGISKNIKGQKAKFTLIIKCDFEVISFENLFLVKINDKEYSWGGEVPPEGKRTLVKLSKSIAKLNFEEKTRIESVKNKPIFKTKLIMPLFFQGGNNEILKLEYSSQQTDDIEIKKERKQYEINFNNIKETYGEFIIKGELMNKCKGEWICDLSDEEIEKNIPKDYKNNKEKFKEIAEQIIKNYDEVHKDDKIGVTDIYKIGKWVNENIKYDIRYKGKDDISAFETYKNKIGVCHHFTKLFNAFVYSLGFKCIYISGYVMKNKDYFTSEDGHAWSLIKINGKWLPFDATWGIFTGKLPVCHIFQSYFSQEIKASGSDFINIKPSEIRGKFLE